MQRGADALEFVLVVAQGHLWYNNDKKFHTSSMPGSMHVTMHRELCRRQATAATHCALHLKHGTSWESGVISFGLEVENALIMR